MGWIKRNLFFVIGGVLTIGLLGFAGFYIFKGWSANTDASQKLNELYATLQQISQEPSQPGNDKIDNSQVAKDQEKEMRDWIAQAKDYFRPIAPIPAGQVTSKTYATALGTTIYQLQEEAKAGGINLPPQYNFSFQVQSTKLTISSGLEPLATQLGEVKAIMEILFAARINELDGIQRVRVSEDDTTGVQSDYIDGGSITNDLAVITPYVVTFQTFSPELAQVLTGFASSPNGFVVKSVSVQPANAAGAPENMGAGMPGPGQPPPGYPDRRFMPNNQPGMPQPGAETGPAGKGGLQTVLKEQLLHIIIEVDIVKLLPKS